MNINDLRSRISELTGNKEINLYLSKLGSASGPMELASVIWFSKADIRDKAELISGLISSE